MANLSTLLPGATQFLTAASAASAYLSVAGGAMSGLLTSTKAGGVNWGDGQFLLNGANSNRIDWNQNGSGIPAFTARSAGTKLLLYPALSGSSVDHAIGIANSTLWASVPDASNQFQWFAGVTPLATLAGNGNFGLGVTPAAWRAAAKALQVGSVSSIQNYDNGTTVATTIAHNLYFNSSDSPVYQQSKAGSTFVLQGGAFTWYTSSGTNTAGATAALAQTMTLDATGNLIAAANVTAYSDERLKTDWAALPRDFIERLAQVKHGTYTRIDSGQRQIGVSAQSLQPVAPDGVLDGEHLSVAYGNVALAAAVELARRVVRLEAQLATLIGD